MKEKNKCKNCGKDINPNYKFCCVDCSLNGWQPAIIQTGKNSFKLSLLPKEKE